MKILAGIYDEDAGTIRVKGAEVEIASPSAAQELGISIIHQELNLMPHLTIAQNIFIGREPRGRCGFPRRAGAQRAGAEPDRALHLPMDPRRKVGDLRSPSSRWSRSPRRCRSTPKC